MGRGTLCIDDGVIRHTYFPKPRSKSYVEAFEMEGEDDWLGSFEVGRDEDGNVKYGPVAPSFIDIEDDMKGHWGNEGYETYKKIDGDDCMLVLKLLKPSERKFNRAFKTKTTKRKLSGKFKTEDVLRLVDGDGDWHARFEIVTPREGSLIEHLKPRPLQGSYRESSRPRMF
ncbi:hypothetical protein Tco_0936023 [Tanacetum coccineum]